MNALARESEEFGNLGDPHEVQVRHTVALYPLTVDNRRMLLTAGNKIVRAGPARWMPLRRLGLVSHYRGRGGGGHETQFGWVIGCVQWGQIGVRAR